MRNVDPEVAAGAAAIPYFGLEEYEDARRRLEEVFGPPDDVYTRRLRTHDLRLPDPDGSPGVRVLVHEPLDRRSPSPALVWVHGGGFVLLNADLEQGHSAMLAAELGVTVISVDYRLAPEHPYPAALDDCYAAVTWASAEGASQFGIDTQRLAIGGRAAGAGLVAATALLARDRGGPALCYQHLDIPALDDRLDTISMRDGGDPMWDKERATLSWRYYLSDHDGETPPYAAAARAENLAGLPPTYLTVCENDCLRDEGIIYAQRLAQAGVSVELHLYPGTFHASEYVVPEAAVSRRMTDDQLGALRRGLGLITSTTVSARDPQ